MLLPPKCPICGRSGVEPVLEGVKILATYEQFEGYIGGLMVFRCIEEGHIFFVRASDLQGTSAETLAS